MEKKISKAHPLAILCTITVKGMLEGAVAALARNGEKVSDRS